MRHVKGVQAESSPTRHYQFVNNTGSSGTLALWNSRTRNRGLGRPAFYVRKRHAAFSRLNPVVLGIGEDQMERMLATPADAEIILKLYGLRTEPLMRQARAWVTGEFWPKTADDLFAVLGNPGDPHNAFLRQVLTYWEMAAAMVLHGAVSAELFVDCNGEGFFLLAKFAPILEAVRERYPGLPGEDFGVGEAVFSGVAAVRDDVEDAGGETQRMSASKKLARIFDC